jgi:multiple sugar transport system ATP-binding protein
MAFQNFALFPHMSAYANVASGLTATDTPKEQIYARVQAVAKMLKIDHVLGHSPRELSNGQKQRTALARALVAEPQILLLDDPLRNVDAKLRYEMRLELPNLLRRYNATVLYVTQDYKEAMALADRIVVMIGGKVLQTATSEEVYNAPATVEIARLFGDPTINLLACEPARNGSGLTVTIANTRVPIGEGFEAVAGKACTLGLRPEDLALRDRQGDDTIPVDVLAVTPLNERYVFLVKTLDGQELLASSGDPRSADQAHGRAYLGFDPNAALLFDGASGIRIPRAGPAPAARAATMQGMG